MRLLFPIVLAGAVAFLLLTSILSAALALALPVVLMIAGLAMILSLRGVVAGVQLMRLGFELLHHAVVFTADVFALVFTVPELEEELTDSVFPPLVARLASTQFPEFHQLQSAVAAELGLRPADELWLSPDTALGITTARRDGRRIRCLVVGLVLVHTLTPEQLRAALFHEFGHERGGDLWLGRWARHLILRLIAAAESFSWVNPARWSAELSLLFVKLGYLPWSRAQEYAADAWAARHAGPQALSETLRSLRRESPAVAWGLQQVLARAQQQRRAPDRLAEAVRRVVARIPPVERHRVGLLDEGDPLDVGGRTHPTISLRIAALAKHSPLAPANTAAFDPARLSQLDERLTRMWLRGARFVPVDDFFSDEPARTVPLPSAARPVSESRSTSPEYDDVAPLELDTDHDWRRRG